MPFNKYVVEPFKLSQNKIPPEEKNVLECSTNLTLANVIRQIESISTHATDLFNDLLNDFKKINERSLKLHQRIEKLKNYQLKDDKPSSVEHFFKMDHFKSNEITENCFFKPESRPYSLQLLYDKAEPPPDLSSFNPFREDNIDAIKLYSDPTFFSDNWRKTHRRKKKKALVPKETPVEQQTPINSVKTDKIEIESTANQQNIPAFYENQQQQIQENENSNMVTYTEEFKQEQNTQKENIERKQDPSIYTNEYNYYDFTEDDDDDW